MFAARKLNRETRHVLEWGDRKVTSLCGYVELEVPFTEERFLHDGGTRGCGHCTKKLFRLIRELRGEL